MNGRSECFSCGKRLGWFELVPVISFVVQRGRCRSCKSRISTQYPLVELLTGVTFFLVYTLNFVVNPMPIGLAIFHTIFEFIIFGLLIAIAVYDIRHMIILDKLVFTASFIAVVALFIENAPTVSQLVAGPAVTLPFLVLWLISKGKWMGLGDAKLGLVVGWFLGMSSGFAAVIIAVWIGAIFGVVILLLKYLDKLSVGLSGFKMNSEIPFGPFLVIGTFVVYLFGLDLTSLLIF